VCSFQRKSVRLGKIARVDMISPGFYHWFCVSGSGRRGSYLRSQNGRHIWIPQGCWCTQSHGGRGKLHIHLCPGCKALQNIRGHSHTGNWKRIKRTFLAKSPFWLHNLNSWGKCLPNKTMPKSAWKIFKKTDWQGKVWQTETRSEVCVNHDFGCCYHWTEWLTSWFGFKYPVTCLICEDFASSVVLWWNGSLIEYFPTLIGHFVSRCDFFLLGCFLHFK